MAGDVVRVEGKVWKPGSVLRVKEVYNETAQVRVGVAPIPSWQIALAVVFGLALAAWFVFIGLVALGVVG